MSFQPVAQIGLAEPPNRRTAEHRDRAEDQLTCCGSGSGDPRAERRGGTAGGSGGVSVADAGELITDNPLAGCGGEGGSEPGANGQWLQSNPGQHDQTASCCVRHTGGDRVGTATVVSFGDRACGCGARQLKGQDHEVARLDARRTPHGDGGRCLGRGGVVRRDLPDVCRVDWRRRGGDGDRGLGGTGQG
jgi:hypothetical protein